MTDESQKRSALFVACMTSFLTPFMGSAINIALPSVADEFRMDAVLLGWVDRLLGATMGLLKGVVLVCIALAVITAYVDDSGALLGRSRLAKPLLEIVELMTPVFPKDLNKTFKEQYQDMDDWVKEHSKYRVPSRPKGESGKE